MVYHAIRFYLKHTIFSPLLDQNTYDPDYSKQKKILFDIVKFQTAIPSCRILDLRRTIVALYSIKKK